MDWVDGGLSGGWMARRVTVANLVTVLVLICYYSFCYNGLFLLGFQGKPPAPTFGKEADFRQIG
jgi:hypothetical protein